MSDDIMTCPDCGEQYSALDLDEVLFHGFGHVPRPDAQYSGSQRVGGPSAVPKVAE